MPYRTGKNDPAHRIVHRRLHRPLHSRHAASPGGEPGPDPGGSALRQGTLMCGSQARLRRSLLSCGKGHWTSCRSMRRSAVFWIWPSSTRITAWQLSRPSWRPREPSDNWVGRWSSFTPADLERSRHHVSGRLADCASRLATLAGNCRALGVTIAVASPLPHLIGGHPDEFKAILDSLDPSVKVCLDTGHTALGGHWRRFVEVSGARLEHLHAHDNQGYWDDHLPPGDGSIDWAHVRGTFENAGFSGWVMLALACPGSDPDGYSLRAAERTAELLGA